MSKTRLTRKKSDFLKVVVPAAGRGDLQTVRRLVNENLAWVHTVGSHGRTMLWEAVYRGKKDVLQFLVERGADVNACGCHYSHHFVEISPYCVAKSAGREDLAVYLLENGAEIDIHSAAYLGDYDRVLSFLDDDKTLVNSAHPQHDLERGPERRPGFHPKHSPWATPLYYAIIGGHKEIVELLISRGAEIEPHSEQLLGFAVGRDRADLVKILLENGAAASKAPRVCSDRGEMSQLLKSYGVEPADVNAPKRGWPPLVYVSRGDKGEHPEKIQRLLDLGADVDVRNYKGKTALHCAAKAGFVRVMEVLISHGADVNAADNNGETPLFDAISSTIKNASKKTEAVMFLLLKGAEPNFKNHKGVTPLKLAQRARRKETSEIVDLLQQSGRT